MSTYTQILYQIVFSTKRRNCVLTKENRPDLFKYIWGILKNKKCHLYRINGVEEHHRKKTFKEELVELLEEQGIAYDEKYLE